MARSSKLITDTSKISESYKNKLLVSMPCFENGDVFKRSLIYVCEHNEDGAMGIVINRRMPEVKFADLLQHMHLPKSKLVKEPIIYFGGPVDSSRGFVLHSNDFHSEDTVKLNDSLGMTGTVEIVRAIANGSGPYKSIFAMGYSGWGPEQLEEEIYNNLWLTVEADEKIIFGTTAEIKWDKALEKLGINPTALSSMSGKA